MGLNKIEDICKMQIPPEPLPVMFWIHGGGWFSGDGTSDLYGPGRLLDSGEVILVSANYRLAAMGFLSMDDEQVSKQPHMIQTSTNNLIKVRLDRRIVWMCVMFTRGLL